MKVSYKEIQAMVYKHCKASMTKEKYEARRQYWLWANKTPAQIERKKELAKIWYANWRDKNPVSIIICRTPLAVSLG